MAEKETEIPEQILDAETLEMVANPDFKGEASVDDEDGKDDENEDESGEEGADDAEEGDGESEDDQDEEDAEDLDESDDSDGDEEDVDGDEKDGDEKDEEDAEDNTALFDNLSEKYEIKDQDELLSILDNTEQLLNDNEQLKSDLEKAKTQDPVFESDKDKKAFEFLKQYSTSKFGNGLGNFARLIGVNPAEMDGKLAMQEAYILQNTDLEREDAMALFNDEYEQYSVDRDEYEDDSAYDKKQNLKNIQKKKDVAAARNYLSEQQEKFKSSDEDKNKVDDEQSSKLAAELQDKAVAKYSKVVDESLDGFDSLIFQEDDKDDNPFTYKLNKEQLNKVDLAMKNYLNNPGIYNEKGELEGFNADETKVNVSMALFGLEIMSEVMKHGITIGETKNVDDVSKRKPKRKAKRVGGDGDISVDDQFEQMAKERKQKRAGRSHSID